MKSLQGRTLTSVKNSKVGSDLGIPTVVWYGGIPKSLWGIALRKSQHHVDDGDDSDEADCCIDQPVPPWPDPSVVRPENSKDHESYGCFRERECEYNESLSNVATKK